MQNQLLLLADELAEIRLFFKENDQGYLYDEDHFQLRVAIKNFIAELNNISSVPDTVLDADKKRILLRTYKTVCCPTEFNLNKLRDIVNEVNGHPEHWKKIFTTLQDIVLLFAAVLYTLFCVVSIVFIPAMIFLSPTDIFSINNAKERWASSSRRGLSESTDLMFKAICQTGGPSRVAHYGLIKGTRKNNKEASITTATIAQAIVATAPTEEDLSLVVISKAC